MKAISCIGLTSLLLLPCAGQALEWSQDWSDWEVRPRISTGLMQYKYDQTPQVLLDSGDSFIEGAGQEGLKAEDSLLFAELGVSVFLGNFFFDLSLQKSDEGDDSSTFNESRGFVDDPFAFDQATNFIATEQSGELGIDREEMSLSIGYVLTDNLGIFVGYKDNETNLDQDFVGRLFIARNDFSIEADTVTSGTSVFEQSGFFLGTTYVWPFETDGWLNGALSLDLGVAFLDGDFSTKGSKALTFDFNGLTEAEDFNSDASGSAVGFNFGIAWSGPLVKNLNYTVGVNGYQYDYDGDGKSADFEDTLVRYSIGLSYAFGAI